MKNPFATPKEESAMETGKQAHLAILAKYDRRSHWDRLDEGYKKLCKMIAGKLSPQNRRVREAVDMHLAKQKPQTPRMDCRQARRNP